MSVEALLARLSGVKKCGNGRWIARAPTREDRTPSLAIRELSDGRILMHDFGGDSTEDVLKAIGLTFADLFPQALGQHLPKVRQPFSAADALAAIGLEATIVVIAAADLADGRPVDRRRLLLAAARIGAAAQATSCE